MRRLLLFLPLILVCGCSASAGTANNSATRLENPLVAERYWDEMVDRMTTLQIGSDPLLQDAKKKETVDDVKRDALQRSQQAHERVTQGISADFQSVAELVEGRALLLDGILYLDTTFASYPGPALHLALTEAVDPRSPPFPDPTSVDLGTLQTPYGAQEYILPEKAKADSKLRTVVLWDRRLGRLYGFAQLAR